jgi:DNA repair protein RadC
MTYSLRIADLPLTERPRERLLALGVKHLATAELIAILLNTGQGKGKLSAIGLAQYILQQLSQDKRDPLDRLRNIQPQELMAIPGIGLAKAATVVAAIELGKRTFIFQPHQRALVDNPGAAAATLSQDLMWQDQERFAVLMLDIKNGLIGTKVITIGTATETVIHPRELFREIIRQGATKSIVAHNHPSGNLEPSQADLDLTEQLLQGAQYLDLPVLDHLILGNGNYQSLRQISDLWNRYPQGE